MDNNWHVLDKIIETQKKADELAKKKAELLANDKERAAAILSSIHSQLSRQVARVELVSSKDTYE